MALIKMQQTLTHQQNIFPHPPAKQNLYRADLPKQRGVVIKYAN
jgi:hypothetical protein